MAESAHTDTNDFQRTAGMVMIASALLSVVAMGHHPTSAHPTGGIGDYVHGAMIIVVCALFFGFTHFAQLRGIARPLILGGLVAYGVSLAAHIGAATINGAIVPALAARGHDALGHDIALLCWEANQALARMGVYATGTAFMLWSIDLATRSQGTNRIVALLGFAAGLAPMVAIAAGWAEMNVVGAFMVYLAHAGWAALVGVQLIRRAL